MNASQSAPAVPLVKGYCSIAALALSVSGAAWGAPPRPIEPPTPRAEGAQSPPHRFELSYGAPNECPTREEFIAWTNAFYAGPGATEPPASDSQDPGWQARPDELAGSLQVKVLRDGGQYTAHLMMVNAGGQCPTVRPPHTETACADAVRAMAYSLAQALKAPPCADASTRPQAMDPQPTATPRPPPVRARPKQKPCPPNEPTLRGEVGVGGGVVTPLAEDVAYGGALLVGFATPAGTQSARLAVGYWDAGNVPVGHDLRARLWSVGVSVCPFAFDFTGWLTLPLCATGEIGPVVLSGVGAAAEDGAAMENSETEDDRANLYLWSSLGVAARLRFQGSWLFAELEPNLVFPLFYHPVYVHQPGNVASERQEAGQVGQWMALKAHLNVGVVFP